MRRFSVRPAITLKGRQFKGLRGWAGKPFHPPLTDFPIAAYVLAAAFDVLSVIGGDDRSWGHDLWHAGTYVFVVGAMVSVFAALTGLLRLAAIVRDPAPRLAGRPTRTPRSC